MSPEAQFVWFGVALVLCVAATIIRAGNKAWDSMLVAAALACGFLVLAWNAAEAMS